MAQGFDKPGDRNPLSLAHAVCKSSGLRLGGFFDSDPVRAKAAEAKWQCPETPRERVKWLQLPWDIVCIATPDDQHAHDLHDVIALKPKAILVEKPLATDPADGTRLLKEAGRLETALLVDFPRRFHSGVQMVSQLIADGNLGAPIAGVFIYSGNANRSASHMLDLFCTWWGGEWSVEMKGRHGGASLVDFSGDTARMTATFIETPASRYVWEMRIFCEYGKVELSNSPETLMVDLFAPHPLYPAFNVLTRKHSFDMESEPLLGRTFELLRQIAVDPAQAVIQLKRESESQQFSGKVLDLVVS